MIEAAWDAEVVLFTSAKFKEEVFCALPRLRLLVRYGIGYDTVDLAAARSHRVNVCNAPSYGAIDVAEHGLALMLAANRKLCSCDRNIREGRWGQNADYPTLRMREKTLGFIGYGRIARYFAASAPSAILVNASRGGLVDTDALAEALCAGRLRAAGLDVFETEPLPEDSPLLSLDNVVLTPHAAWLSTESIQTLHEEVTSEVVRFLEGKPNLNIVNR